MPVRSASQAIWANGNRSLGAVLVLVLCVFALRPAHGQGANYTQAEELVRNHQWDAGLAQIQLILKSDPRNTKALNLAGLALIGKGDIEQANEYFRKCLNVNPAFAPALKNLSINEFNTHDYASAEKHLLAASKIAPDDPVINLYLGEISFEKQRYQNAAQQFERAGPLVARNPNAGAHLAVSYLATDAPQKALPIVDTLQPGGMDPRTQFQLAIALDQASMPERALPWLEAVRRQYPNSYEVGFDLMLVQIAAKNYATAIQTGDELIAQGHETSELNNILAEAYAGNNQVQKAVDAYRRAIALDPSDEDNYLDFASLCMNQRSFQAGMTVMEVALKSHPQSARLVFMRGLLHAMQDEFELAEKDFKLSSDLAPEKNLGAIGLGVSFLETGHDAQAIDVLHQRLREKPNDASLEYLLGEALLRSGATPGSAAYTEAQNALEKSIHLNPNLCLPHISLGTIYLDEDRNQDAVGQFEQARAIDPTERSAYSHLAVAYRRLGEQDKAKEQDRQGTREKMKSDPANTAGQPATEDRVPVPHP
jgi:tetratricopeptide (TPR) repeat protein